MSAIDTYNFKNKNVLVRVDFNVPLNDGFEVLDSTRLEAAVPTIAKIISGGGKVILMSHLGRPKGQRSSKYSLEHIVDKLSELVNREIFFIGDCIGKSVEERVEMLKEGEVLLLENLRFYPEETAGDAGFAKQLADLGDVYINDAFGTVHRKHASTAIIASFFEEEDKLFGYVIERELAAISSLLKDCERPFTAIMGGAKVSDKMLLIEKMLDKVDHLIIGGGMSYTFFKALGGSVGSSLVEEEMLTLVQTILDLAREKNVQLLLPEDSIVASKFSEDADIKEENNLEIEDGWMGLDIGPKAIVDFSKVIEKSKTIMWNGPMGVFEMDKFQNGTKRIAEAIVSATENGGYSLIGGGDSAAAINKFKLGNRVSYVSTGGGALLELLEGKDLPGIEAIQG